MEVEVRVIRFWLNAFSVLLYGCWMAETNTVGHSRSNHTSKDAGVYLYGGVQFQEVSTSVVYTLSGNDNNAPCVFPFIYDGMKFTECTSRGDKLNKLWCATTSSYDKDKKWGYCQTDNDVTDCMDRHSRCGDWARDGECVVNSPYMCRKCPRSCGLCTHGANGRGRSCTFPFFYKNKFVYDCLQFNKKTWCSTTTNYNKDKRWGYCFPKFSNSHQVVRVKRTTTCYLADVTYHLFAVFRDIKAVNRKFFYWGECDDQHEDCVTWASKGLCDEQPEKMHSWCPWSCHKCAPELLVTHRGCKDLSSSCKAWAEAGDCLDKPVFMFAFCRWTCKQCAKSSIPTTGRDRMPQECQAWVKNGDCFLHQEFMLQNCRESCLAGGYVEGRMCLDTVTDCHDLAREGYCKEPTSLHIMKKYCKYSCKWCTSRG